MNYGLVFCYVLCSILCFGSVMIFDYLLSMWYMICFRDFCWDRKLLLDRGDILGLCFRKRYAIYAFPVWFMYADMHYIWLHVVFPSGTIMFVCVILNMFLHSDFDVIIAWLLWIPHTYMLCNELVIWYAIYAFVVWRSRVEPLYSFVWFRISFVFWIWCHCWINSVNSVYIMLCDDFVLWIWNLCIYLTGFWVISGFVWHSGSLVEHSEIWL